jgi:hypothetical protein
MHDTKLDKLLTSPIKFGIMAQIVASGGVAPFAEVCAKQPDISNAAALSFHANGMERGGLVARRKLIENGRHKTLLAATNDGMGRFADHCEALRAIAALAVRQAAQNAA